MRKVVQAQSPALVGTGEGFAEGGVQGVAVGLAVGEGANLTVDGGGAHEGVESLEGADAGRGGGRVAAGGFGFRFDSGHTDFIMS